MTKLLLIILLFILLFDDINAYFNLTLVISRSVIGEFMPINTNNSSPCTVSEVENSLEYCSAGFPRFVTYVNGIRDSAENMLLIDGGQFTSGSEYQFYFNGTFSVDMFNYLNYNISVLDYKDLNMPEKDLGYFINNTLLMLSSNIDVNAIPSLKNLLIPYKIFTYDINKKIAFYSLIEADIHTTTKANQSIIENFGGWTPKQLLIRAMGLVPEDVKYHVLFHIDRRRGTDGSDYLTKDIPGLDLIIRLKSSTDFSNKANKNIFDENIFVVNARNYERVTRLDLSFDDKQLINVKRNVTDLDDINYKLDDGMWNILKPKTLELESLTSVSITTASIEPSLTECRFKDCPLHRLYQKSVYEYFSNCDMVLTNAGTLQNRLPSGTITTRSLVRMIKFRDEIILVRMSGEAILNLLRNGVTTDQTYNTGSFIHPYGLRYAYNDYNRNIDQKRSIVQIQIWNRTEAKFRLWRADKYYIVAITDYMRTGDGGMTECAEADLVETTNVQVVHTMEKYLKTTSNTGYTPLTQNQIDTLCNNEGDVPLKKDASLDDCLILPSLYRDIDPNKVCKGDSNLIEKRREIFEDDNDHSSDDDNFGRAEELCSGLGFCNGIECVCDNPTKGPFSGRQMVRGAQCSTIRTVERVSSSSKNGVQIVSVITAIVCIFASIIYAWKRKNGIIRSASPLFLHLINLGGVLWSITAYFIIQDPTISTCTCMIFCGIIGFNLTYGSLFLKTYRIASIFSSKKLGSKRVLHDFHLLAILFGNTLLQVLVLTIMSIIEPLDATVVVDSNSWGYWEVCSSSISNIILWLLFVWCFLILIGVLYYAFRSRKVPDNFNESRFIYFAIANVNLTVIIMSLYILLTWETDVIHAQIVIGMGLNFMIICTQGFLFAAKISGLRKATQDQQGYTSSQKFERVMLRKEVKSDELKAWVLYVRELLGIAKVVFGDEGYTVPGGNLVLQSTVSSNSNNKDRNSSISNQVNQPILPIRQTSSQTYDSTPISEELDTKATTSLMGMHYKTDSPSKRVVLKTRGRNLDGELIG